jgi:hypothetical protein
MLLRILQMMARRKRVGGGTSPIWTAVTLATFLIRWYQRREASQTVSLREELRPGESLVISHTTQPRG